MPFSFFTTSTSGSCDSNGVNTPTFISLSPSSLLCSYLYTTVILKQVGSSYECALKAAEIHADSRAWNAVVNSSVAADHRRHSASINLSRRVENERDPIPRPYDSGSNISVPSSH